MPKFITAEIFSCRNFHPPKFITDKAWDWRLTKYIILFKNKFGTNIGLENYHWLVNLKINCAGGIFCVKIGENRHFKTKLAHIRQRQILAPYFKYKMT